MFRRLFFQTIILLGLAASFLSAGDFWLKKKYSEWSPKEVRTMLNDSPWAKRCEVVVNDAGSAGGGVGGGRGRPPSVSVDRSGRGGDTGSERAPLPRSVLLIRFHTALPIKQAVARGRFGDEVLSADYASKMLSRKEEAIIIGITGSPRLLSAEPAELKGQTWLVIKGKEPIPPEKVVIERSDEGLSIYLTFQRAATPIKLEDESFELQVKFRTYQLKQRFKLKDMVFEGNLEL